MFNNNSTLSKIISKMNNKGIKILFSILVFLPILAITIQICYSIITIKDTIHRIHDSIDNLRSNEYNIIMTMINENYKHAKIQTESIKLNIIQQLNSHYRYDKQIMKIDYESKDTNTDFYKILSTSIDNYYLNKDNSHNRVFIANRKYILVDNSSKFYDNSFHEWKKLIDKSNSQKLLLNSINSIITDNEDFVIWIDSDKQECTKIKNTDIHNISDYVKTCVYQGNIKCLNQYSIAVVSFIFKDKDIFDTPDIEYGKFTDNEKIYIIEVINIKDMIDTNIDVTRAFAEYDVQQKYEESFICQTVFNRIVITIILGILNILLFFGLWCLVEYRFHEHMREK